MHGILIVIITQLLELLILAYLKNKLTIDVSISCSNRNIIVVTNILPEEHQHREVDIVDGHEQAPAFSVDDVLVSDLETTIVNVRCIQTKP